jgi:AcrR family transcriptional regulator
MARPREFDENLVLDKAMQEFWSKGYEGTSLQDLLNAMGLTKSSLYQAFGSKEALFAKVVERYRSGHASYRNTALQEATPRRIAERLLFGAAQLHSDASTPAGCLELNASLACSAESEQVRAGIVKVRLAFRRKLRDRLRALAETGAKLPAGMDADSAALLLTTTMLGMGAQARSGSSRNELQQIARAALLCWPED